MADRHDSSFRRIIGTLLSLAIALFLVVGPFGLAALAPRQRGNRALPRREDTPSPANTSTL